MVAVMVAIVAATSAADFVVAMGAEGPVSAGQCSTTSVLLALQIRH
jgi:hypothetical protein